MAKAAAKTSKKKVFKKKEKRIVPTGVVHIQASFNNTLVSITDTDGKLVCWSSGGVARLQRIAQGDTVRRSAGRSSRG